MNKNFKILTVLLMLAVLMVPAVMATRTTPPNAYAEITQVKINGDIAENGDDLYVERGDKLTVRVTVEANEGDMNDAYLGAFISGYRYAAYESQLVTDFSNTFTLPEGNKRSIDLDLEVPMDMEKKDAKLRIILFDENSASIITYNYQLSIYGANEDNAVEIRDFFISPSTTIEAGRALSFKVKVKNFGNYDLDDVKVKVEIPELDIQTYETIDTLEKDEVQSFEALLLRIPADADPGDYEVIATVEFDRYEEVSESAEITIIDPKGTPCTGTSCDDTTSDLSKTVVTMPASVDVVTGTAGSVYPILVQNKGTTAKTYVLSTSGVSDWGTAVFEPSSVFVLKAGQSQTVYLKIVALKDAQIGDKVMKITITAGDEMKDTTVIASVKQGTTKTATNMNLKNILEWFLVLLVVVLIVLGLIVAFRKLKKGKDSEDEQSYY
ncbi:MAG: putative S-layer protein [Candidatus Nanoarchaeia archaeon]